MKYITKKGKIFYPNKEMKKIAWISNDKIYKEADKNPVAFWEKLASDGITWEKKWTKAYDEKLPYFKWFVNGKLNVCANCLDRHLEKRKEKTALIWVPEPTKEKTIKMTYGELFEKVCKTANLLKNLGVKKGNVVAVYLPMIPELIVTMLACARIGAIHSVVFSAFSADALKARLLDGKAKVLVTSDVYFRRGKPQDLKSKADESIKGTSVKKIIVVNRSGKKKRYIGRYLSWDEIEKQDPYSSSEIMESNDTLFILYTSGTTGKPKGVVHDTGGYLTQTYWTAKWDFNLHDEDILWCTADIGWITGHSYACYGPLANGVATLIYEGAPDFPNPGRWWKIIQDEKVTVFYTAPTAIRMFMKFDEKFIKKYNLDSLKILGTVGEPIDENAWLWYLKKIGRNKIPIIDTWWQTETGGTLINSLPGIGPFIPTVAGRSFPGTRHEVVNDKGRKVKPEEKGNLIQLSPFAPGMLQGIFNNPQKYKETYWKRFREKYDTSDGAFIDKKSFIRLTGRVDDVMKVAGHRLATAEVENAIDLMPGVRESAVAPKPDEIRGQVPVAFVILKKGKGNEELEKKIISWVTKKIGPTARPEKVYFVKDLPKTRSGKIMRRILKDLLIGEEPTGLMTLVNPECVGEIRKMTCEEKKSKNKKSFFKRIVII